MVRMDLGNFVSQLLAWEGISVDEDEGIELICFAENSFKIKTPNPSHCNQGFDLEQDGIRLSM